MRSENQQFGKLLRKFIKDYGFFIQNDEAEFNIFDWKSTLPWTCWQLSNRWPSEEVRSSQGLVSEGYDIYHLMVNVIDDYLREEFGIWEGDHDENTSDLLIFCLNKVEEC